jgi:hypothetical protein
MQGFGNTANITSNTVVELAGLQQVANGSGGPTRISGSNNQLTLRANGRTATLSGSGEVGSLGL